MKKGFIIGVLMCILFSYFASSAPVMQSQAQADKVFQRLLNNDGRSKTAVFVVENPEPENLSRDSLGFMFNEYCGHILSYDVLLLQNKSITYPVYNETKVCWNETIDGKYVLPVCNTTRVFLYNKTEIKEDFYKTDIIYTGLGVYKLQADVKAELCNNHLWGYSIEWIPQLIAKNKEYIQPKWAWWNESTNLSTNLAGYYTFDQTTGALLSEYSYYGGKKAIQEVGTVPSTGGILQNSRGSYSASNYFKNTTLMQFSQTGDFSINVWINQTSDSPDAFDIIFNAEETPQTFRVFWAVHGDVNKMVVYIGKLGGEVLIDTTGFNPGVGVWNMWTLVHHANKSFELYMNGTLAGSNVDTSGATTNTTSVYIGNDATLTYPSDKELYDEMAIYIGRALNVSEMQILYNNGLGLNYSEQPIAGNAPPTVSTPTIYPSTAYYNTALNCSAIPTDAENISLDLSFRWWKNNNSTNWVYNTTRHTTNNTLTYTDVLNTATKTSGENWSCAVRAEDGNLASGWLNSTIQIQDTELAWDQILDNSSIFCDENLTLEVNATDPDNSIINYYINSSGSHIGIGTLTGLINYTGNCSNVGNWTYLINATDGSTWINLTWLLDIENRIYPPIEPLLTDSDYSTIQGVVILFILVIAWLGCVTIGMMFGNPAFLLLGGLIGVVVGFRFYSIHKLLTLFMVMLNAVMIFSLWGGVRD